MQRNVCESFKSPSYLHRLINTSLTPYLVQALFDSLLPNNLFSLENGFIVCFEAKLCGGDACYVTASYVNLFNRHLIFTG